MRDKEGERLVVDMEDLFSIHPGIGRPGGTTSVNDGEMMIDDGSKEVVGCGGVATDFTDLIKAKIASHPRYPSLLSAYIDCRKVKVGAPPEMAILLEEMARERSGEYCRKDGGVVAEIAADPELDKFMDSYCRALVRYKDELSKPFDDAMSFISSIEAQLLGLSKTSATASSSSSTASATASVGAATPPLPSSLGSSDDEPSYGDDDPLESYDSASRVPDNEVKEMLFRKYSGYLSSLKKEFLKKRNKGKIPREARSALLDWWNIHYQWPYPTEEEKVKLAELTGLDQKQINNWFINQRKRHWKPSEDTQLALVEPPWSGSNVTTFCFETGAIGP